MAASSSGEAQLQDSWSVNQGSGGDLTLPTTDSQSERQIQSAVRINILLVLL
jgi:hypothetical protein